MQFNITWRDGAYYVSEPNIGNRTVVDLTDYESVCAERDRLKAALEKISSQMLSHEVDPLQYDDCDFESGYDACVVEARAALQGDGR